MRTVKLINWTLLLLLLSNLSINAQNVPVLSAPVNGSIWDSTTPKLQFWIVSATTVTYHVQVSTNPNDFISPGALKVDVTTSGGAAASYQVQAGAGLYVGVTYYWRVGVNGVYSAVSNFTPSTGAQATYYNLTVTQPANGTITVNPNQTSVVTGSYIQFTAVPDYGYYFAGWTGDASGTTNPLGVTITSDYSLSANFQQTQAANLLVSPLNSSSNVDQDLTFYWNSYTDAASYQFILSESVTLNPSVEDDIQLSGSSDPLDIDVTGLNPRTLYYWRVIVALNGGGSVNSPIWSFTTGGAIPLSEPVVTSPPTASSNVTLNPTTINWSAVTGAESYDLQVSDLVDFSNLIVDQPDLFDVTYGVNGLAANTQYFVRVRANSSAAPSSDWSSIVSFTTVAVPGAFNQLSPANAPNPQHPAHQVYFEWEPALNAEQYQLVVTNVTAAPFIQLDVTVTGTEYTGVLTSNNSYSFTVTAKNSAGNTPALNGPFSFQTGGIIYVDMATGIDDPSTSGTEQDPFKTIVYAVQYIQYTSLISEGSVVMVKTGVYGRVDLSYPITLIGYGASKPQIEQISIWSSNINIDNFILIGDGGSYITEGIIISPNMYSPLKFKNITIKNIEIAATAYFVSGLWGIDLDGVLINNCDFSYCNVSGIKLHQSKNVTVSNTVCKLNFNQGILLRECENLIFENVSSIENHDLGMLIQDVNNSTFSNLVLGNDFSTPFPHEQEIGMIIEIASDLTFTDCTFSNNEFDGCLMLAFNSLGIPIPTAITNIVFEGNNNFINNNTSGLVDAGGLTIVAENVSETVAGVTISGNPVFENNYSHHIMIVNNVTDVSVTGGLFKNDPASSTLGVHIASIAPDYIDPQNIKINNNVFEGFNSMCLVMEDAMFDVDARNNVFLDAAQISDIEANLIYDITDDPTLGNIITDGSEVSMNPLIDVENINGFIGASYLMDVNFYPKSQGFLSVQGAFTFDADELEYVGYLNDGLMNDNLWTQFDIVETTNGSNGEIEFHGWGLIPITNSGKLFALNMKVKSTADEINSPESLAADPNDFSGLTITGVNTYPFIISGGQISYAATTLPTQSKGDVDLNGLVEIDDFNILLLYVYGNTTAITDPQALDNADFNDDSIIDINDAIQLYAFLYGTPPPSSSAVAGGSMEIRELQYILDSKSLVIPIELYEVKDMTSFEVIFYYDPSVVSYQAFKCVLESEDYYALGYESEPGEAKYTLYSKKRANGSLQPGDLILRIINENIPENSEITTMYCINGQTPVTGPVINLKDGTITDALAEDLTPAEFYVNQNYPNPFNPTTTIQISLPVSEFVSLKVYNMLGQEVKELVHHEFNAGVHRITWNGTDSFGNRVASGNYIYRIVAGKNVITKKMVLLK